MVSPFLQRCLICFLCINLYLFVPLSDFARDIWDEMTSTPMERIVFRVSALVLSSHIIGFSPLVSVANCFRRPIVFDVHPAESTEVWVW